MNVSARRVFFGYCRRSLATRWLFSEYERRDLSLTAFEPHLPVGIAAFNLRRLSSTRCLSGCFRPSIQIGLAPSVCKEQPSFLAIHLPLAQGISPCFPARGKASKHGQQTERPILCSMKAKRAARGDKPRSCEMRLWVSPARAARFKDI